MLSADISEQVAQIEPQNEDEQLKQAILLSEQNHKMEIE